MTLEFALPLGNCGTRRSNRLFCGSLGHHHGPRARIKSFFRSTGSEEAAMPLFFAVYASFLPVMHIEISLNEFNCLRTDQSLSLSASSSAVKRYEATKFHRYTDGIYVDNVKTILINPQTSNIFSSMESLLKHTYLAWIFETSPVNQLCNFLFLLFRVANLSAIPVIHKSSTWKNKPMTWHFTGKSRILGASGRKPPCNRPDAGYYG